MSERSFLRERPNHFTTAQLPIRVKVTTTVCQPNCFSYCPHTVTVRDGRVVQTTLAPFPIRGIRAFVCADLPVCSVWAIRDAYGIHCAGLANVGRASTGAGRSVGHDCR